MPLTGLVTGVDVVCQNIKKYGDAFFLAVPLAANQAADVFKDKLKSNISLRCHSLQDLADMGHPYARNWLAKSGAQGKGGKIGPIGGYTSKNWLSKFGRQGRGGKISPIKGRAIHDESDTKVHTQSGQMVGSIFSREIVSGAMVGVETGLQPNPPQNVWVVFGTSKMIPRPVVWATMGQNFNQIKAVFIAGLQRAHIGASSSIRGRF